MADTWNKLAKKIAMSSSEVTYAGKGDTANVTELVIDLNLE